MNNKPVLAFLQNMWVRNPDRVRRIIATDGEKFRLYFIEFALFRGCKTGRVLKKVFGEDLLEQFVWEETTREIAGDPKTIFPPDLEHIKKCLEKFQPKVVITFGTIAKNAVTPLWSGPIVHAHHPASRHPDSLTNLTTAARILREHL